MLCRLVLCWMCDSPRTVCTWRTTSIYVCRRQAEIEWAQRGISLVACCHSVKLCILAAWAFQLQQSSALTRMWSWCQVQPSQKECAIGAVHSKKEGRLLQPLGWRCAESAIHHKWDVCKEQQHKNTEIYVTWASNNRVISSGDLYYCLLPQCEALRTCRSSFLITTQVICFLVFRMHMGAIWWVTRETCPPLF